MNAKFNELLRLFKKLPANSLDSSLNDLLDIPINHIKEILSSMTDRQITHCPCCGVVENFVKYGKKNNKQRYRCKSCERVFTATTGTALSGSHFGEQIWIEVIRDTLDGTSLKKTAKRLEMNLRTVTNMRYLLLNVIEQHTEKYTTKLTGECETDDTYVLESVKGTKIGSMYHRKARTQGSKATLRGTSKQQISINCMVSKDGGMYAKSVNRSKSTKKQTKEVYTGRIDKEVVLYCDGANNFNSLEGMTKEMVIKDSKYLNYVNGFHSFIKGRIYHRYHGIATKYMNKYNAMFSLAYGHTDDTIDFIFDLLRSSTDNFRVKTKDLAKFNILDLGQFVNL